MDSILLDNFSTQSESLPKRERVRERERESKMNNTVKVGSVMIGVRQLLTAMNHNLQNSVNLLGFADEAKSTKILVDCYYYLFFTSPVIPVLITQTNLYADQSRAAKPPASSNHWQSVTKEEIVAFLELHIAMGIYLPSLYNFWSTEPISGINVLWLLC